MNYKIAICDDSDADRRYVLNMVRAWASSAGHTVHIDDFPSAESFLFRYAEESDYDILLLDIEMGAMDGVTMAKELRKSNDTEQIIFITGYSDYISEGYEVAALHYLMKPVKDPAATAPARQRGRQALPASMVQAETASPHPKNRLPRRAGSLGASRAPGTSASIKRKSGTPTRAAGRPASTRPCCQNICVR